MRKAIILYKSKYGSSKEYADLLSEELSAKEIDTETSELKNFKGKLDNYDIIVYAAGIKAYMIYDIRKFLRKAARVKLHNKKVVVMGVGMLKADLNYAERLRKNNAITSGMRFYYLRGAMDINKLKGIDASIIKMLARSIMMKENLNDDENAIVNACINPQSWVKRDNIIPIAEYIAK
ncbi:MAG: hypothetical protein HFK07_06090 [Clostridia bacterium]|jgi:menaquinone-dependent protoporphyrinogen IX oxidase|nr:hypothetical protein [Clostridia bacterium]